MNKTDAYVRLSDRLAARGLHPDPRVLDGRTLAMLGTKAAIGGAYLGPEINGFEGVDVEQVRVEMGDSCDPLLPAHVLRAREAIPRPQKNWPKAHLAGWVPPVEGRGGGVTLSLCRSDWWSTLAIEESSELTRQAVRSGELAPSNLPMRLDVVFPVLTADNYLALYLRGDRRTVRYDAASWAVSGGQQIHADDDVDADGIVSPAVAARRALMKRDELNLGNGAGDARIRCVAFVVDWSVLTNHLICVVRAPRATANYIVDHFSPGENVDVDIVRFALDTGLELFLSGRHAHTLRPSTSTATISDTFRLALLTLLFHEFGFDNVVSRI